MNWRRWLGSARRAVGMKRPRPGRVVMPDRRDAVRDYPSAGLTPSRLTAVLRAADDGDLCAAMQLFEEMEEKDAHLYAVANTRRLALTGLDWRVVSAAEVDDRVEQGLADEAAAYCREVLGRLETFDEVLQHLALALGRNIAIAELVWEIADGALSLAQIVPVEFTRITLDSFDRPRILTAQNEDEGINPPPNKFIIHTPHSVSGHPQRGGLLRVTSMVYLAKNLALKDWLVFSEVFGMPIRIARHDPAATAEEKRELLEMLESLGGNAAGVFSQAIELQVLESNRGAAAAPYRRLIEFLNREISKTWLGQTLTTDISGQSGSVAASGVHETVRQDILASDIRKEGRTIRRDLLGPLVRLRFGDCAPVPYFRRNLKQPRDLKQLTEVLDTAVNRLGMKVPQAWLHDVLGVPQSGSTAAIVPGRSTSSERISERAG